MSSTVYEQKNSILKILPSAFSLCCSVLSFAAQQEKSAKQKHRPYAAE
jgi:hypothetical protein